MSLNDTVRDRLQKARAAAGYKQGEFADQLLMPRSTYGEWETGVHNFTVDEVERLADELHVPIEKLLGLDMPLGEAATALARICNAIRDPDVREELLRAAQGYLEIDKKR